MNLSIITGCVVGLLTGIVFYGGLWLTVRALLNTRHPVLLTLSSFWIRTTIVLSGFLFFVEERWQAALAWIAGFALSRLIASSLPKSGGQPRCT